ncbi:MAG: hypothetical protein M1834_003850 [Cirrosporium novae-zelandiae]|nr:MAG: hypothetical protein M1834_003850 [Cirrosporium novae-zelandiae]
MVRERHYEFSGSDAEYILFLESKLKEIHSFLHLRGISQNDLFLTPTPPLSLLPQTALHQPLRRDGPLMSSSDQLSPCPLPPSAYSRIEHNEAQSQLQLVVCDPSDTVCPHNNEKPRWKQDIDKLLAEIPDMSDWISRRKEMMLVSAKDNRNAINFLLKKSMPLIDMSGLLNDQSKETPKDPSKEIYMLEIANSYASFTRNTLAQGKLITRLGLFQALIFVSLCAVLAKIGISSKAVHSVMRVCITNSEDKYLRRLRRGSIWVNRCISELSKTYWSDRSSEIFLICGQSLSYYGRYADASESLSYFTDRLKNRKYANPVSELSGWIPFSIPCIIKSLIGDSIMLSQICDILHYDLQSTSKCYEAFCNISSHLGSLGKHSLDISLIEQQFHKRTCPNPKTSSSENTDVLEKGQHPPPSPSQFSSTGSDGQLDDSNNIYLSSSDKEQWGPAFVQRPLPSDNRQEILQNSNNYQFTESGAEYRGDNNDSVSANVPCSDSHTSGPIALLVAAEMMLGCDNTQSAGTQLCNVGSRLDHQVSPLSRRVNTSDIDNLINPRYLENLEGTVSSSNGENFSIQGQTLHETLNRAAQSTAECNNSYTIRTNDFTSNGIDHFLPPLNIDEVELLPPLDVDKAELLPPLDIDEAGLPPLLGVDDAEFLPPLDTDETEPPTTVGY